MSVGSCACADFNDFTVLLSLNAASCKGTLRWSPNAACSPKCWMSWRAGGVPPNPIGAAGRAWWDLCRDAPAFEGGRHVIDGSPGSCGGEQAMAEDFGEMDDRLCHLACPQREVMLQVGNAARRLGQPRDDFGPQGQRPAHVGGREEEFGGVG